MEGVVVLFLLEVLRQTEVTQNVVLFFLKCLKRITPKLLHLESNLVLVL